MNFKELMQRMRDLDSTVVESNPVEVAVDECGMMPPMPSMGPSEPPKQQDSVTMNVSMNGSGAGGIRDLMSILRNIEDGGEEEFGGEPDDAGQKALDVLVPKDDMDDEMDGGIEIDMDNEEGYDDEEDLDDDFENEPDTSYGDVSDVTGTGNDIHSKGAEAPKVNGGGNPRSVASGQTFKLPSGDLKIRLESLYQEIKSR